MLSKCHSLFDDLEKIRQTQHVALICPECGNALEALPLHDDDDGRQNLLWMCKTAISQVGSCIFPNSIDSTVFWVKRTAKEKRSGFVPLPDIMNLSSRYWHLYPTIFIVPPKSEEAVKAFRKRRANKAIKNSASWTSSASSMSPSGPSGSGLVPVTQSHACPNPSGSANAVQSSDLKTRVSNPSECGPSESSVCESAVTDISNASVQSTISTASTSSTTSARSKRSKFGRVESSSDKKFRVDNCLSLMRRDYTSGRVRSSEHSSLFKDDSSISVVNNAIKLFDELPKYRQLKLREGPVHQRKRCVVKRDAVVEKLSTKSEVEKIAAAFSMRTAKSVSELVNAVGGGKASELRDIEDVDAPHTEEMLKGRVDSVVRMAVSGRKLKASSQAANSQNPHSQSEIVLPVLSIPDSERNEARRDVAQLVQSLNNRSRCASRQSLASEINAVEPQSMVVPSPLCFDRMSESVSASSSPAVRDGLLQEVQDALMENEPAFDESMLQLDFDLTDLTTNFNLTEVARMDPDNSHDSDFRNEMFSDGHHVPDFNFEDVVSDPSNPSFFIHDDLFNM